jgi:hypothetical protein
MPLFCIHTELFARLVVKEIENNYERSGGNLTISRYMQENRDNPVTVDRLEIKSQKG